MVPNGKKQPARRNLSPAPYIPVKPAKVPENYVDVAESVMRQLSGMEQMLTTSKIRNILSMASDIYNREKERDGTELLPESRTGLQKMRVRLIYEAGRDASVRIFLNRSNLLAYLKGIGTSRGDFVRFENYLEALVAYHRFFSALTRKEEQK